MLHRLVAILVGVAILCAAADAAIAGPSKRDKQPNIVVVLADDLGYGDLGCYGNKVVKTPNLDAFARKGLRLTSCYAAHANCSPSRAGLLTGRTPTRIGVHNWIPFLSPMHLRQSEITIATLLRRAGYTTCHVGKWHLNGWFNLPGQPQPNDHGFDYWFSTQNNALPNHRNPYNFVRNGIPAGPIQGYSADIVVNEAIDWLQNKRDRAKPFFLFVCFHEPHEPIATAPKYEKLYPFRDPSKRAHHGNITQMDAAFGRLMQTLEKLGLDENTLIFFTSDNGPAITAIHPHGSAGPLRAKKGHLYEGGIRVPGIFVWAGRIRPGQVSDVPVSGVDLLPTVCSVVGIDPPKDRVIDGADVSGLFAGKPVHRKRPLYWHFNAARSKVKVAMREGDWVILAQLDKVPARPTADILPEHQKWIKTARPIEFELYNLRKDIGQKHDLAAIETERLERMKDEMLRIYREVQLETPTWPAWTWPRWEQRRIQWPDYWKKKKRSRS